jgi:UDP-glucose:(heptosyl)LPS alpha-1,3-glucosyltransferase
MPDIRLKVAFVVDRFGSRFGGAEAYGVALMRELSASCDITVFARDYDRECGVLLPYVPIQSWKRWPSWCRVLLFAVKSTHRIGREFDIVHSHVNGWNGDIDVLHVTPVRYKWRVKSSSAWQTLMAHVSPRIQTYLGLEACRVRPRAGHRTVAVSGLIARQLSESYGPGCNVQVIPPGVQANLAYDTGERQVLRRALGYSAEDQICLLVARNPLRKGLPVIMKALERLPGHVKLLVVGGRSATRDYVSAHAGKDVTQRVHVVDETSMVSPYYAAADLYVHPTSNDSYGMAPLEAMAAGLPVILSASPWCGLSQYIRHGHEALLLSRPDDAAELAESIASLLRDDTLRLSLAQAGRAFSDTRDWRDIARQYIDLYAQVLAERQAAPIAPGSAVRAGET